MPSFLLSPSTLLRRVKKPAKTIGRSLQFFSSGGWGDVACQAGRRTLSTAKARGTLSIVVLVLLQVAVGLSRERVSSEPRSEDSSIVSSLARSTPTRYATLEILELALSAFFLFLKARACRTPELGTSALFRDAEDHESHILRPTERHRSDSIDIPRFWSDASDAESSGPLVLGTTPSNIAIVILALPLMTTSYFISWVVNSGFIDSDHVHIVSLFVPLISATLLYTLSSWESSSQKWLSMILQISGILTVESPSIQFRISWITWTLFALALLISLSYITLQYVYKLHASSNSHRLNLRLFAFELNTHLIILLLSKLSSSSSYGRNISLSFSRTFLQLFLHASIDIISLDVIYHYDAVILGVSTSLSTTILIYYSKQSRGDSSISDVCGTIVAVLGFIAYMNCETQRPSRASKDLDKLCLSSRPRIYAVSLPFLVAFIYIGYISICLDTSSYDLAILVAESQPKPLENPILSDFIFLPPPSSVFTVASSSVSVPCKRDPLPSVHYFPGQRTYHEFDDVLLVVFFSHARYDVNLDYYKEVYAEFFPNMVFVGPRSREDKGFSHSYDVLVDSYESDEDVSDVKYFKMAGRMAHHMLYTVLTTPPYSTGCYKGFLWVPFDTLLNVPRLQLFDQSRMWYFSPWAEYVDNPAVTDDVWLDAKNHAPPARVSPDPESNFVEVFEGWWKDWWWGDPHYGIPVCMPALERVPLGLRKRMALRFTNSTARFVGGSADTLYIPAQLVPDFVQVLGLFLETNCFLEIAVPTAVHLVLPEDEDILFVDHWWIWDPPFNASFVRDAWAQGMEVDTFHTFHWGDKDASGLWKAIPENIEDVRELLRESAARQGIEWVSAAPSADIDKDRRV
ncbi:hypothetical protein DFH11DRAFT_1877670 [Phellopilus nigrolimitatus]|nr:hypothetical protein DFH11DRAFT_1877670 [Phellopilus nigrolimitatus]